MDLPSLCRSARAVYLGGVRHFVRPLSLDGLGTVLGWLDDTLPGHEERTTPPRISEPASWAALGSPLGVSLLIWLALRDQGVTPLQAQELALRIDDAERSLLLTVLLSRRRSFKPSGVGDDIAETWFGPPATKLMQVYQGLSLEAIGRLSLDQFDALASGGCEDEDPSIPSPELMAELDRQARENAARQEAELAKNGEVT